MTVKSVNVADPTKQDAVSATPRSILLRWYALAASFDTKLQTAYFLREPTRFLRYLRRARRGIRHYEPLLESVSDQGGRRPFSRYMRLWRRFGHSIDDYYRYGFHGLSDDVEAAVFLSERRLGTLCDGGYEYLGVDARPLLDKVGFASACGEYGLPAISTIAEIERRRVVWGPGRSEERLPEIDLITKPRDGKCGDGVCRWIWDSGGYLDASGERLAPDVLLDRLSGQSRHGPMMIQPCIQNAEPLLSLAGGRLCTLRIVTSRPYDGTPEVQAAVLKMAAGSNVADNFANKGVAAPVGIESGEVGAAVSKSVEGMIKGESFSHHPDTKMPIAGLRLPDWKRVLDACVEAHSQFPAFHSVGWDVAITNAGPVLLEGNHNWDPIVAQQPGLSPLGRTGLLEHILSFFDDRKR